MSAADLIVVAMRTYVVLALAFVTILGVGSEAVSACGDKFLSVGRGVSFQRAYAAIHPASILIVLPPKSVKSAAVRDSGLQKALKMAGHRVEVVQQPANLVEILGRAPYAIVLAERADASAIRAATAGSGQPNPSIVAVLEDPSSGDLTAAREQLEYVLKTPQPVSQILNLVDDVMKARLDGSHRTAAGI
jgi:hypothetical protein